MKNFVYEPHELLAPYIKAFAIIQEEATEQKICFHPSNLPILCFDLNKKHFKETGSKKEYNFLLGLSGVMDKCIFVEKIPNKSIQVIFKPYGAFRLFKTPMNYFVNKGEDFEAVMPNLSSYIHKLQDSNGNDLDSIQILEQLLLKQLKLASDACSYFDRIQFACEAIKNSQNTLNVSAICKKVGMSETRFRLHFKEKIGISPKKFSQIETFQQIKIDLHCKSTVDWMDIVEKYSFYDQTHFIKNFKWFFSCTPSEYLKRQRDSKLQII